MKMEVKLQNISSDLRDIQHLLPEPIFNCYSTLNQDQPQRSMNLNEGSGLRGARDHRLDTTAPLGLKHQTLMNKFN